MCRHPPQRLVSLSIFECIDERILNALSSHSLSLSDKQALSSDLQFFLDGIRGRPGFLLVDVPLGSSLSQSPERFSQRFLQRLSPRQLSVVGVGDV